MAVKWNTIYPPVSPQLVTQLEPWTPVDELQGFNNAHVLGACLEDLSGVRILQSPETQSLYVVNKEGICYDAEVTPQVVGIMQRQLHQESFRSSKPFRAGLAKKIELQDTNLHEEAVVRCVHRALGRACLMEAAQAETSREFADATENASKVFNIAQRYMYSSKSLTEAVNLSGLLYMFKRTARHFKTISPEQAKQLIEGIDIACHPRAEKWADNTGSILAAEISYRSRKLKPVTEEKKHLTSDREVLNTVLSRKRPKQGQAYVFKEQARRPSVTDFHRFANGFPGKKNDYINDDAWLSDLWYRYKGETPKLMPVPANRERAANIATAGVLAYLVARGENGTAQSILQAMTAFRHQNVLPILAAGNLIDAKSKYSGGRTMNRTHPILGFQDSAVPKAFTTIRKAVNMEHDAPKESQVARQLAGLVKLYLQRAY